MSSRIPRSVPFVPLLALLVAAPAAAFPIQENCWPNAVSLGVNAGHDFELVRQANLGWARITIPWRQVNPERGVWNFNGVERVVDRARAEGLQVLAILSTAPEWAGGGPLGNTPPTDVGLWREFARRTAERFAGRIVAYEIWNEPDLRDSDIVGVGWDRPLDAAPRYTDYLEAAAREIRGAAPGTLVVGPVTSSRPRPRTEVIYRQLEASGVSHLIDVISFHANGTDRTFTEVATDVGRSLALLETMNPRNADKPIWITEFGWFGRSAGRQGVGGESAQRDLIRYLVDRMAGAHGCVAPVGFAVESDNGWSEYAITHAFIFTLLDGAEDPSGVYRTDRTAKPVVTDYLQGFGFPARVTSDPWHLPVTWACSGLECGFSAGSAGAGGDLLIRWVFGDGSAAVEAGATVEHTYAAPGRYFVRVGVEERATGLSLGGQTLLIRVGGSAGASPGSREGIRRSPRSLRPLPGWPGLALPGR